MDVKLWDEEKSNHYNLEFVVIVALYHSRWICVKHKKRKTWELPGGHIEKNELPIVAARRELYEETGTQKAEIEIVCDYEVIRDDGVSSWGRLFFANVQEIGELPESEIETVRVFDDLPADLTYPEIQTTLFKKVKSIYKMLDTKEYKMT